MKPKNPIYEQLIVLRDEVKVQGHLFEMELKDKYEDLEKRFHDLSNKIESSAQKVGQANEEFWLGYHEDLDKLKKEYQDLKENFHDQ